MRDNRTIEQCYAEDGFVFPLDVIGADQAAELIVDLEAAEAELADDPERLGLLRAYPDRLLPSFDKLTRHPKLITAVSKILGPDLMVWSAALFIKEANSPKIVSWHQDLTYWGLDDAEEITCWVALSDASIASGAMKFVPGSHTESAVDHIDTFNENNLLSRGQEIAVEVDEKDAVAVVLAPGQSSMHHGHLFHASGPNTTGARRIGSAIRYLKASMKQRDGTKSLVAHVSGEDKWGNFKVALAPKGRLHEDDFELCRQDAEARRRIFYAGAEPKKDTGY
jgi:ectoine hydroxylase-related dioxygenase (phytanoyl-CoA dioxygenase family)